MLRYNVCKVVGVRWKINKPNGKNSQNLSLLAVLHNQKIMIKKKAFQTKGPKRW